MKEMRRVLALLLCFVMLVGYVPVGALGAETDAAAPVETQAVEEVVEAVLGEAISVSGEKTDSKPLETGTEAPAEETETVEEIVEAVIGPVVSVSKSDSEETETEPATTEAVEETEATVETYPAETDAEEAELLEEETAYEEAVLAAVDDDALTAALEEAKAYVEGITINNSSNDPATVVKNFKTHFTWDNEKRENSKSYLFDWSYYNGVVFEGMEYLYEVTGTEEYKDYVMEYMSSLINADGSWATCTNDTSKQCAGYNATHGADCYKTASLLLDAYEMSGDERYLTVAEALYADLDAAAKNYSLANAGSNYRHTWADDPSLDLWLDGLYMILPFRAEYAKHIGDTEELDLIVDRMQWVSDNMYNSSKGLFYHAADSATSNSGTYWLRSIGWYAAAIVDIMDSMEGENLEAMKTQLVKLVDGMKACQNASNGMWLNNMAASESDTNPYETSGTALVCYAVMKAVNEGWLDETYADMAIVAFNGICTEKLSGSTLTDICFKGAPGSSNSTFYDNEGKGVGPFIMAYAEVLEHATREAEPAVDSLKISGKTEYYVGDTFENPTVTAVYTSGEEITVTDITVAGVPSMTEAGTYTVTVSYGGVSAEYTVSVLDLSVVSVEIENGDILTAAGKGLTDIKAQWNESHNYDVVFDTYQPYAAYDVTLEGHTAGDTASLTMTAYGVSTEDLVAYAVAEDGTVTELTIKSAVQNPEYPEYLDVTFDITGSGTYAVGSRYIAIPEGAVLQEITMVQAPSVLKYFVEEVNEEGILPLDITGLKVKATYANDTETVTKNIYWNEFGKYADGYSLSVDMTKLGDQDVVISYTYGEETKTVSYGITIYEKKFASEKTDVKIELTVPGVTEVTVTDQKDESYVKNAVTLLMKEYVAYDIVLEGYNQGEKVTVTMPLPDGEGDAVVYYIPADGTPPVKVEGAKDNGDGTVTFETDHFTTYASGRSGSAVSGSSTLGGVEISETPATSVISGSYYVIQNNRHGGYLSDQYNTSNGRLSLLSEKEYFWYVTVDNGSYYVQYGGPDGPYLTFGSENGVSSLTDTRTALGMNYGGSTWTIAQNGYYLNHYNNEAYAGGWNGGGAAGDAGSQWNLYKVNYSVTYTRDNYQMEAGSQYIILGSDTDYALTMNGTTIGYAPVTVVDEGNDVYTVTLEDDSDYAFYFADRGDGTYLLTRDGTNTVYHSGGSMNYGDNDNGYWAVTDKGSGQFTVANVDGNTWYLNYGYVWGSNTTDSFSVSSIERNVRLFKRTAVNVETGASTVNFSVSPAQLSMVAGRMYVLTPQVNVDGVESEDYTIAWNSSDSSVVTVNSVGAVTAVAAGTATVTATLNRANGKPLSSPITLSVEIKVVPQSVVSISPSSTAGKVYEDSVGTARTGTVLTVEFEDGVTVSVPVTVNMLRDADGNAVDVSEIGTQKNLTIVYGDKEYKGYTLHVVERPNIDFPDYPDPGSVTVSKGAADTSYFQNVGVAEIELTASAIPMKSNVDVLLVLDLSNSMAWKVGGNSDASTHTDTKLYNLQQSVATFTDILLAPNDDGTPISNTMGVVTFGGIDKQHVYNPNTTDNYNNLADVTQTLVDFTNNPAYVKGSVNNLRLLADGNYTGGYKLSFDGGQTYAGNFGNTNYDYAFMQATEAINTFKTRYAINYGQSYEQSGRKMYVLFMTDGAPTNYNGNYYNVDSNGNRIDQRATWIDRNGNESRYSIGNGGSDYTAGPWYNYLTGYNATTQTTDGNPLYWADQVANIGGVTEVISIGFDIDNGGFSKMTFTEADGRPLTRVLENLVSGKTLRTYKADNPDALKEAYEELATEITQAATNSYFADQMGGSFDLQRASYITKFVEEGPVEYTVALNPAPKITISTRNLYKSAQVGGTVTFTENGESKTVTVTGEMVGQPYGDPVVVETVYFSPDGSQAYSDQIGVQESGTYTPTKNGTALKDKDGNDIVVTNYTGTNILRSDGVIEGKYFYYNTTTSDIMIDKDGNASNGNEYKLEAETFCWKIGTIDNKQFIMNYYVVLEGAAEGDAEAGSYATNNFATLYYTNYRGEDVELGVDTPVLVWDSVSVSYGFYLVDSQGRPVKDRATGALADDFGSALRVTDAIPYNTVKMNATGTIELDLNVSSVLPQGYKIYDAGASYKIVVDSVGTASGWYITNTKAPDSTYVENYNSADRTDFTNQNSADILLGEGEIFDFSKTVVWFAVMWEPQCVSDVIVIDYGLPVDISVMQNDIFGDQATLNGIAPLKKDNDDIESILDTNQWRVEHNERFVNSAAADDADDDYLAHGDIQIMDEKVRYTPTNMQMNTFDKFVYEVLHPNTDATSGNAIQEYYYGSVTVIPATTIYYEDTYVDESGEEYRFFDLESFSRHPDFAKKTNNGALDANGNVIDGVDNYGYPTDDKGNRTPDPTTKWEIDGITKNTTQAEDRPGRLNPSDIDANNVYGYDGAYDTSSTHSLGSARKIHIQPGVYGTANFSFWGTGFDVVSMTSNTTGALTVKVFDYGTMGQENAQPVRTLAVDTYYGYDYGWYYVTYLMTKNGWAEKSIGSKVELDAEGNLPEGTLTDLSANANEGEEQTIAKMCWVLDNTLKNAMYQVPVLEVADLPYGHYEVELKASYYADLDHTAATGYDLYLDAIRIYDPAGTTYDVKDAEGTVVTEGNIHDVIQDAYFKDSEAYPIYTELRNELITAKDFNALEAGTNDGSLTATGAIFIDQQEYNYTVSDYISYGPNNELYLAPGQAVAFALTNLNSVTDVQIGLKNANGDPVYVKMIKYNKDTEGKYTIQASTAQIDTDAATDRYYSIGKYIERDGDCVFSFQNTASSTGILSITNIKFTHSQNPYSIGTTGDYITIGKEEGNVVLTTLSRTTQNKVEQETPEVTLDAELDVNIRKTSVKVGSNVVVKATTSADVAALTVAGVEVSKYTENRVTGKRSWTAVVKAEEVGDMRVEVIAYSADGDVLEKRTKTVEVTASKAHAGQKTIETIISKLFR